MLRFISFIEFTLANIQRLGWSSIALIISREVISFSHTTYAMLYVWQRYKKDVSVTLLSSSSSQHLIPFFFSTCLVHIQRSALGYWVSPCDLGIASCSGLPNNCGELRSNMLMRSAHNTDGRLQTSGLSLAASDLALFNRLIFTPGLYFLRVSKTQK